MRPQKHSARKFPRLHIGTSGWTYGGWNGIFYPAGVKTTPDRLAFYAGFFDTVEVNYSFYHLPKPETYQRWSAAVPPGFEFALKASRLITHLRRLEAVEEAWARFIANARTLKKQLGPVLFQLPPSLRADPKRLSQFLSLLHKEGKTPDVRPVFEFRHESWFNEEVYAILKKGGAALCIAHSSRYPCVEEVTADLVYFRFHGPETPFGSSYSRRQLGAWARRVRPILDQGKTVYIYFNNDFKGYALENARTLGRLLSRPLS